MIVLIVGLDSAWIVHCWFMNETRTMVLMSSAVLVPVMDHMSVCRHFRAKIPILEQISIKTPQRSRTSRIGHFPVLLPQNDVIITFRRGKDRECPQNVDVVP